ncbi:MAG: hypothetical protein V1776_03390 [Candidatus Diapherotrites archaeon]
MRNIGNVNPMVNPAYLNSNDVAAINNNGRFIHGTLTKLRIQGMGGVLLSLRDQVNPEIRSEIAQLCDQVIKV